MQPTNFSLVNQALAFANTLQVMASEVADPSTSAGKLRQDALLTSSAFHLGRAFHFYLREIAERCLLKNAAAIDSLGELEQLLVQAGRHSQDMEELLALAREQDSWLSRLQRHAKEFMQSPPEEQEKKAFPQNNLIHAVDLTAVDEKAVLVLTPNLVCDWQEAFRSLVLRQRDTSAEF